MSSKNIIWNGYLISGQKNNGNDLLLIDFVMDLGENRENINGNFIVNYEVYSDDENIEKLSSRLFFNNSNKAGNVTGGNYLATDKFVNFNLGFNTYNITREEYTNKTYRYLHCLVAIKCKDQTKICNLYLKNVYVKINDNIFTKIENIEPNYYAPMENSIITKVDNIIFEENQNNIVSPLKDKKWLVIGDSITENNFRTTKHYHDYIKELTDCIIINDGRSGTGYMSYYKEGNLYYKPIYQRIAEYDYEDVDIISLLAGTNDWARLKNPLGQKGDTSSSTIYGCIDITINQLIAKYPNKIIFTITPLPRKESYKSDMNNSLGYSLEDVVEAIIYTSRKYSIPCLDLFHGSNLRPWLDINNEEFFKATGREKDGLHPNEKGHKRITPIILKFLESLVN